MFHNEEKNQHILDIMGAEGSNKATPTEQAKKEYAKFSEKVKRSVFIDNLSPAVMETVIEAALGQFGNVKSVEFIPNYTIPYNIPNSALVEMKNPRQAGNIINEMENYPFMISGMPRPIRAAPAKAEMFANRPTPPDRKIQFHWLDPKDPDFEVANRLKRLCRIQTEERLSLINFQLEEEQKLADAQSEMLKANYKKHEMVEEVVQDGAAKGLARMYGIKMTEDRD